MTGSFLDSKCALGERSAELADAAQLQKQRVNGQALRSVCQLASSVKDNRTTNQRSIHARLRVLAARGYIIKVERVIQLR